MFAVIAIVLSTVVVSQSAAPIVHSLKADMENPVIYLAVGVVVLVATAIVEPLKWAFVEWRQRIQARNAIYEELVFCRRRLNGALESYRDLLAKHPTYFLAEDVRQAQWEWRDTIDGYFRDTKAFALHHLVHSKPEILLKMNEWPGVVAVEPLLGRVFNLLDQEESPEELEQRMYWALRAFSIIQYYESAKTFDPARMYRAQSQSDARARDRKHQAVGFQAHPVKRPTRRSPS